MVDLSSYNNDWFNVGAGRLKVVLWYFCNVLFLKNGWNPCNRLKVSLLRLFGAKIGKDVVIKPCVNIKYPWNLEIGDNCWIGENVWIDNLVHVKIGNNVCLSQGALLLCGNHNYKKKTFDLIVKEIFIEDGAWIGAKCTVCQGVNAKECSVLTVGSVATKDLDAYAVYSGNPATRIRKRVFSENA